MNEWIDDDTIMSYLELLANKYTNPNTGNISYLDTFYVTLMESYIQNSQTEKVSKLCEKFKRPKTHMKSKLEELDKLIIPINEDNVHWWLIVVFPKSHYIVVYDSFESSHSMLTYQHLKKTSLVQTFLQIYGHKNELQHFMICPWVIVPINFKTIQIDSFNCAIFMLIAAEFNFAYDGVVYNIQITDINVERSIIINSIEMKKMQCELYARSIDCRITGAINISLTDKQIEQGELNENEKNTNTLLNYYWRPLKILMTPFVDGQKGYNLYTNDNYKIYVKEVKNPKVINITEQNENDSIIYDTEPLIWNHSPILISKIHDAVEHIAKFCYHNCIEVRYNIDNLLLFDSNVRILCMPIHNRDNLSLNSNYIFEETFIKNLKQMGVSSVDMHILNDTVSEYSKSPFISKTIDLSKRLLDGIDKDTTFLQKRQTSDSLYRIKNSLPYGYLKIKTLYDNDNFNTYLEEMKKYGSFNDKPLYNFVVIESFYIDDDILQNDNDIEYEYTKEQKKRVSMHTLIKSEIVDIILIYRFNPNAYELEVKIIDAKYIETNTSSKKRKVSNDSIYNKKHFHDLMKDSFQNSNINFFQDFINSTYKKWVFKKTDTPHGTLLYFDILIDLGVHKNK